MHLRSIQLRGFKSFPDPVEVAFEPGVSVVVGPNGSGKSNVADAIVWAAGSLSPNQLRAEKPDDVIYAGSATRDPAEFCEVELCFDNSDGQGGVPFSELSIMRRLHRGGEGQYLVNRNSVRRLDVLELLADIGLGGEMHAIISQGRVDAVLSSKPVERRALIEEAAGLGTFKQRRRRAELKLKRVGADVDRARDLEAEVRKRLRPLALQASAAERAEKLRDEISELECRLWSAQLWTLDENIAEIDGRRASADVDKRRADEALEGILVERATAEDALQQAAGRHESATAALYRLRSALERLDVRRESSEEVAASLRTDHDQLAELALVPRDATPLDLLEKAEEDARARAAESRAALEKRERASQAVSLAADRLRSLERSLAEREGLPPAARALADEGCSLALSMLDVEDGYERAVAAALSWRGSAVLAHDSEEAVSLLERSRNDGLGTLGVVLSTAAVAERPASECPPDGSALADHTSARAGGESVERLLDNVWLLPLEQLTTVSAGVAVTAEGHCFDADRGELWYEGETARSVMMGLETRHRELIEEVNTLRRDAEQAGEAAALVFESEREARERLNRARMAAAKVPKPVDPAVVERLSILASLCESLVESLRAASERAHDFESPLQARVDAGSARTTELGAELRQLGEREAALRARASDAQRRLSAIEVENARFDVQRRDLVAKLGDDGVAEALDENERVLSIEKLEKLRRRLEGIGAVNPLAAQEHAVEKERLTEVTAQREDLEKSVAELERLCVELTQTVERRFTDTFTAVQKNFAEVAGTLFPGGEGRLRLTEPEADSDEPGVEVELRPAGKTITRLSLLSGGEKALGALSFLFALFLARPCPFYLLDEVEAALDDANIGRFVELLRRYADRAQFVVVTHQKTTMDAADILYGVTMGPDGVSQLVSRRMRESAVEAETA
jgi:chromosome segregation protein